MSKRHQHAEKAGRLIRMGGVAVVAGVRPSHLPDEYHSHPAVVFWEPSEGKSTRMPYTLPANCHAVLLGRLLSHGQARQILKQVRQRANVVTFPGLFSTAELKKTLDQLLYKPDQPVSVPVTATADVVSPPADVPLSAFTVTEDSQEKVVAKTAIRGPIKDWVRGLKLSSDDSFAAVWEREGEAAREQGFSQSQVKTAFYAVLSELRRVKPKAQKRTILDSRSESNELVKLVDDAIAALTLVREAAVKSVDRQDRLREMIRLAKELE